MMEIDKKEAEEREKNKVRPDMPNEDALIEFDKHDENKNGQLTPQEFIKLIRSQVNTVDKDGNVIEIPEEGIIKTFKKYDTNKDISVSKEEFTAKIADIVPGQHPQDTLALLHATLDAPFDATLAAGVDATLKPALNPARHV